jgi:hypothetical protein
MDTWLVRPVSDKKDAELRRHFAEGLAESSPAGLIPKHVRGSEAWIIDCPGEDDRKHPDGPNQPRIGLGCE